MGGGTERLQQRLHGGVRRAGQRSFPLTNSSAMTISANSTLLEVHFLPLSKQEGVENKIMVL